MSRAVQAYISNIQHFCVHDGDGFRTTVFLQGCNLRCRWCQNPELQPMYPVHMYDVNSCENCFFCIDACPKVNLRRGENSFRPVNLYTCNKCNVNGTSPCVDSCFYGARNLSSRPMSAHAVMQECLKDSLFYGQGGGITLSGGEAMLSPSFSVALGELCREHGISLYVETCGYVPWENLYKMLDLVEVFLYDLKLVTPSLRREWLGATDETDLNNLAKLVEAGAHVVLRVPLIPGINDTEEEFSSLLKVALSLGNVRQMHILPFHQLGAGKYRMVGKRYLMAGWCEENKHGLDRCRMMAEEAGFKTNVGGTGTV